MGSTIGKIGNFFTKDLTHTGVQSADGSTQYYPNPQAAASAASSQIPSAASLISGTPDNPTVNTPTNLPQVQASTPTTKGAIFAALIRSGLGGLAATGAPTAGQGALQAMHLLNSIDEQRRLDEQNALITQVQKSRLAEEPGRLRLQGAELANVEAQTQYHKRQLELAGRKPERAPTEVDLAIAAAGPEDDPEAIAARKALSNLGKGAFAQKEPKTYDALVLASQLEDDPQKKARYDAAIAHIEKHRDRPTRSESEVDNDRRIRRDANLIGAQALAANGGKEDGALSFLTRTLAADHASGGKNLSDHERAVTATAILMLRHKTNPLDEIFGTVLANQNKPKE
jgi:hypothetical protein